MSNLMFKNKAIGFSVLGLLVLAIMLLAGNFARAQISTTRHLQINDKTTSINLVPALYVTTDHERNLTYSAIITRHLNNILGDRHDGSIVNMGLGPVPTWMIATIDNNSTTTDWVLHFGQVFDGRYGLVKKLMVVNQSTGQVFTRALREKNKANAFGEDLNGPSLAIKLRPRQSDIIVIYAEAAGGLPATIAPQLMTSKKFIQTLRYGDLPNLIAGVFGIAMIGFFLAVIYMERRRSYLFFLLYYVLLSALFFTLGNTFFADISSAGELLAGLYALCVCAGLPVTKAFLEISVEDHRENFLMLGTGIVLMVLSALGIAFFDDSSVFNQFILLAPSYGAMAVIISIAYLQSKNNKYGALYYMFGWMALFIGATITGLSVLNDAPSVLFSNAFWLSMLIQAGCFIYATTQKVRMTDEEFRQEKIRESRMARSLARLKQSKESADQARLLRVIERERELMSELREREMLRTEEMRKAKEIADQANRAKSAFLAVVTHEIRTPMTGIMGMVRLLLDTKMSTKQSEYALAIQKSGDTMIALLNDILDFEKSKGGKMELEMVDFDLLRLAQDVVLLMSGRTSEKNIFLKADIDPSVPRFVRGDPARLRQILLNLVTNAIKFTSEGGVTIRLRATPVDKSDPQARGDYAVYFGIEDTGIGIPEEMQKNLFIPFMQADSSVSRKYGGTGLGLAICKKLIEAMGGTISVNSQQNAGSTFFFTIQMQQGDADLAALTDAPKNYTALQSEVPKKNILVVEDNEMNRRVLQGLLEKYGHDADLAKSGEDALEKVMARHYDMILMDIELPGMTGDETTRALRNIPDPSIAGTPVIALTGHIMMEDIERFLEANMNGHIAKPIQPEQLLEMIKRVHTKTLENPVVVPEQLSDYVATPRPVAGKAEEGSLENIIIKKIPPSPEESLTPLQRFLMGGAKEEPTEEDPDFYKTIDVTSSGDTLENDHDVDSFEAATRIFEDKADTKEMIDTGLINPEMLESLRGALGAKQLEDLFGGFFETCDQITEAIEAMIAKNDTSQLQARAHELKGMAANFGITKLSEIAGVVEHAMRDGKSEEALAEARKLKAVSVETRTALRAWMS